MKASGLDIGRNGMKYFKLILVILIILAFLAPGYCALNNWGNTDLDPLLGREFPTDLMYKGTQRGGVSTIVSTVSQLSSTNLAFSILKLSGASKTFSMAAGETGAEITLVKIENDARTLKLDFSIDNPRIAHTGFTSVTWPTTTGSFVTLAWIDSTVGWIITGSYNVTIAY